MKEVLNTEKEVTIISINDCSCWIYIGCDRECFCDFSFDFPPLCKLLGP